MNRVFSQLAKQKSKLFKLNYAPEYKTFTPKFIAADPSHPLRETQRRRAKERKREGLWWHATTGNDLSKSSCVRAWARRRLRAAVVEELRARGYDENGKFINISMLQGNQIPSNVVKQPELLDLKGSLRLHIQAPLLPAKFVDVKAEAGKVVDIMVEAMKISVGASEFVRKISSRPLSSPTVQTPKFRPIHVKTTSQRTPSWMVNSP